MFHSQVKATNPWTPPNEASQVLGEKKRLTILHFRKHLAPMKTMNHLPLDDTGIWLTRVNCDNNDS